MIPDPIKKFVERFSDLPSIGPRQATRLAFYLVGQGKAAINDLAKSVYDLSRVNSCVNCFNAVEGADEALCLICSNPARRPEIIAIIEKETDLLSLEKAGKFGGQYLVLGEIGKDGILTSFQKLRLSHLKDRIKRLRGGRAEEIIVATNHTTYGDIDAALVIQELKPFTKKISRLGRGLPTGGEIEFADEETLGGALDNRS